MSNVQFISKTHTQDVVVEARVTCDVTPRDSIGVAIDCGQLVIDISEDGSQHSVVLNIDKARDLANAIVTVAASAGKYPEMVADFDDI